MDLIDDSSMPLPPFDLDDDEDDDGSILYMDNKELSSKGSEFGQNDFDVQNISSQGNMSDTIVHLYTCIQSCMDNSMLHTLHVRAILSFSFACHFCGLKYFSDLKKNNLMHN